MTWNHKNIGAALVSRISSAGIDAVAAGAGDDTEAVGAIIDLDSIGNPQSAKAIIAYTTTLADTETLSIACDVDHGAASDLADAAQFLAGQASTVVETASGAQTLTGVVELDVNLSGAKRYIRLQFTPDLSASSTDTAELAAVWVFGGFRELPATDTI